ncbi:MAG: serine hydrolase, partial [Cloacibacterium sp.]
MKQKIVVTLILLLTLVSCKKEFNFFQQENENGLPNYGNVDVENVFTAEDSQLQDKQNVVNAIQQYYDKVWEKGDLSGGFLVAKGDKILFESYRG